MVGDAREALRALTTAAREAGVRQDAGYVEEASSARGSRR